MKLKKRILAGALRSRPVVVALALAPAAVLLVGAFERRWMDDDGFINLRVVRNLLRGDGPVFNLDERVEAFTSPLWLAVVAALGGLGLRLEYAATFAGIALTVTGLLVAQSAACRLQGPSHGALSERLRAAPLPLGAAIFAVLPAGWDYASSGLETGLAVAWLGACSLVMARHAAPRVDRPASPVSTCAQAALVGLGPLIRPELALYVPVPLVLVALAARRAAEVRSRSVAGAVVRALACAAVLPLAYQVFRMGYYASVEPNTALAKEAFLAYWVQGRCYFHNFFGTYALGWPLAPAGVIWVAMLSRHRASGRGAAVAATLALPLGALVHVIYIVRMGGDYMHGRMFVPPVFAALSAVAMVPPWTSPTFMEKALCGVAASIVCVWLVVCAARLRVGVDNVCGIGDERGWYAREAKVDHPVALESYRGHTFYEDSLTALQLVDAACPGAPPGGGSEGASSCRLVHLSKDEQGTVAPARASFPLVTGTDPRIHAVLSAGAIGMLGYLFPSSVHVIDRHGLADPLTARAEIGTRGRPGHEKRLPVWWMLARFAEPAADEDAAVTAARHALRCGPLGAFEHAVTARLTFEGFVDNLTRAWGYSQLRLPGDAFEAETTFCGTPDAPNESTAGSGGTPFHWRCPQDQRVSGLRGTFSPAEGAIASVRAVCGHEEEERAPVVGPSFGDGSDAAFEVACPPGATAVGIAGAADNLVRSLGLTCAGASGRQRTADGGEARGPSYDLTCPPGTAMLGVEGRAGALVDAIGIVCGP